jgi:thiol-disulfide isomerase/thioredoxin
MDKFDLPERPEAPEISAEAWYNGDPVKLSELRGKVVLLHFFQVNCPACFTESIPKMEFIHRKYGGKDVVVIGVACAFEEWGINTKENLEKFLKEGKVTDHVESMIKKAGLEKMIVDSKYGMSMTHAVALDKGEKGSASETFETYGANGTPFEVLIDRSGRVVGAHNFLSSDPILYSMLEEATG